MKKNILINKSQTDNKIYWSYKVNITFDSFNKKYTV